MPTKKTPLELLRIIRNHEDANLPSTAKYILLIMALYGDDQGGNIYPGRELLAKKTGLNERTIQKWWKKLQEEEYLMLDGRYGKVQQWVINGERFMPGYQKTGYQKLAALHKTVLEPTDEEPPRVPKVFRAPEPPPAAPEPPALQPITFDAEYLRNQRKTILGLLKRARAGEPAAMHWWESSGQNSMARLETINQMLGLDAEIEENEGVPV